MNVVHTSKDPGNTSELAYRVLLRQTALTLTNSSHVLKCDHRVDDLSYLSLMSRRIDRCWGFHDNNHSIVKRVQRLLCLYF
jgi:hypothetical protein